MGLLTKIKIATNRLLAPANLRLDSCTVERFEAERLQRLVAEGHFDNPIFPVLPQFEHCDPSQILEAVASYRSQFAALIGPDSTIEFSLKNEYYSSPDAEVLYALTRLKSPRRIVEIGSGNSTRLFRAAIRDGAMKTVLTSIDPHPRRDVSAFADETIRSPVELVDRSLFERLEENDFLFIDSSHRIEPGNDVLLLFLNILTRLRPGVIVHVHDIFLPFEYPQGWIVTNRWKWTEQYLVQALLQDSTAFNVLWAGYYLERTRPELRKHFEFWCEGHAGSLWLQRQRSRN